MCLHCVLADWEQSCAGNNRVVDGIDAGGKVACCNVGRHGRFMPCFNENLTQFQIGDSAIGAALAIQQQKISLKSEDRFVH